jgi:hypothetical protein
LVLVITALGLLTAMIALPVVFGLEETPRWSLPYLDAFSKGLINHHKPWGFTTILPATTILLFVFPYLVKNFLHEQLHPGKLFMGMSVVTLSTYFFLLPAAESLLQSELTATVKTETQQKQPLVETHGFRSYALYFHGQLKPEQMEGPWLTDTFVLRRSLSNPYPIQEAKRVWIKDATHREKARLITKSTFVADRYFRYQFNLIDSQGAYFVWQRR